jgi:hypothetical protein
LPKRITVSFVGSFGRNDDVLNDGSARSKDITDNVYSYIRMRIRIARENIFAGAPLKSIPFIYINCSALVNDVPASKSEKISRQKKDITFENPSSEYA